MNSVSTRPERRLMAVVFTDMANFTRRTNQDESKSIADTERDLDRITELCRQYGGEVGNYSGDGLLLLFKDATRSVCFALAAQQEFATRKRLRQFDNPAEHRMGIHMCDIPPGVGNIVANGVNIAARLQKLAPVGGICASDSIYREVVNTVPMRATSMGVLELKGITEEVTGWRLSLASTEEIGPILNELSPPGIRFRTRDQLDSTIGNAKSRLKKTRSSAFISGNDGKFIIEVLSPTIDELLKNGKRINILLVDPDSNVPEMLAKIDPRFPSVSDFYKSMGPILERLKNWTESYPSNFEYRLISFLPALGFFITDADSDDGVVKVEMYTYFPWEPTGSRPHFVVPLEEKEWRAYFLNQWANYWNSNKDPQELAKQ